MQDRSTWMAHALLVALFTGPAARADDDPGAGAKRPLLAFAASAALPGLGQIYGARPLSGALFLGAETVTVGTYLYLQSEGDSREIDFMRYAQAEAGAASSAPDGTHDFDKYYEDLIKESTTWGGGYFGNSYVKVIEGNDGFETLTYQGDATHFFDWEPISPEVLEQEIEFLDYYADFDRLVMQKILDENQNDSYNQKAWKDAAETNLAPDRSFTGELSDFFDSQAPLGSNGNLRRTYDEYRVRAYGGTWAWNWAHPEGDQKSTRPVGSARTRAEANLAEYKRLRGRANDSYKQATFVGGLALFNHVVSSIHAAKGAALKNRERLGALPGGARLGLGVNPSIKNPGVELRLTRAF